MTASGVGRATDHEISTALVGGVRIETGDRAPYYLVHPASTSQTQARTST